MCGVIASDEARHAKAYKDFMLRIFEVDPSEAMIAFEDMMRNKIVMPAHFLREVGLKMGQTRSEEHTSELQSLMRISYAVFCLKQKIVIVRVKSQFTCDI